MRHFKYLKYIIKHKWYVMLACFRRGLIWQGIIHDWSKLLPCEWFSYANYFYGDAPRWDSVKYSMPYFSWQDTKEGQAYKFNIAWLHHQHLNPHHWQYWVLRNDNGTTVPLDIPHKYLLEMLADWEGAGIAITGKREYKEWYRKNQEKMILSEFTKSQIEKYL